VGKSYLFCAVKQNNKYRSWSDRMISSRFCMSDFKGLYASIFNINVTVHRNLSIPCQVNINTLKTESLHNFILESSFTSQETHYVSATKPNRLTVFIARTIRNT
jgi:hypothetical protein